MKPVQVNLTYEDISPLLNYEPSTGVITWKVNRRPRIVAGQVAGSRTKGGYIAICILGKKLFAHRLAWLLSTKSWPAEYIDHINGQRDDNRIQNLRQATKGMNNQNLRISTKANKSCGLLGVTWNRGRWTAQITCRELGISKKNLGRFDSPEEAHQAYIKAKRELHKGCML